jgi:hypothetical protein
MNTNFRKKTAGHIILPLLSTVIGSQVPSLNQTHNTTYPKLYFPLHFIHVAITHWHTWHKLIGEEPKLNKIITSNSKQQNRFV